MRLPQATTLGQKVRVLHVSPSFYPATYWGGPIHSVHGLCNHLARLPGVDLRVVTTDSAGPRLADRVTFDNAPVRYAHGYDVFFFRRLAGASISVGLLQNLSAMIRWADVVHLTAVYSFPTLPTLLLCQLLRKPVVWSPRGALQATHEWGLARKPKLKRLWEWACRAAMPRKCVLHVTSNVEEQASLARLPGLSTAIIPNGVDVSEPLPKREWRSGGVLRLMFIGRLDPKKGLENLFQALALMNDNRIVLNVYGIGSHSYAAELEKLVRRLDLLDRVALRGFVEGEAKQRAFYSADTCVVPSHSENFANVVAESLSFGVPVIVSKGAPWAEVEKVGCGLWVENSAESLASAITRMRESDLARMGANGRRWVREAFSWDIVAREMLDTYRRLALQG